MATENSGIQMGVVEQPFGCDPAIVHCPICGQATLDPEWGDFTPCPHVAFFYTGLTGDFEFMSDDFHERISDLDDDFELENFLSLLKQVGYSDRLLVLQVTSGGMGCGPISNTDVYGFDYETLANQAEG